MLARLRGGSLASRASDVRDFILRNVIPYAGDDSFLVGPSQRTLAVWRKPQPYFAEERKKGVPDVSASPACRSWRTVWRRSSTPRCM